MVIICSNENDITTFDVIDWLRFYNEEYIIINENTKLEFINYKNSKIKLKVDNISITVDENTAFWYRRGEVLLNLDRVYEIQPIRYFFKKENSVLTDFINKQLDNYSIGAFKNNYINKLEVLLLAKKIF